MLVNIAPRLEEDNSEIRASPPTGPDDAPKYREFVPVRHSTRPTTLDPRRNMKSNGILAASSAVGAFQPLEANPHGISMRLPWLRRMKRPIV
ncbi:predicted protein [Coccidioides posadasii str. Silveira]|uniref:Predicted protein n=1 Tax=Coccidioides posadasii (strain RMSCC 757 / Silveira) TaxID=443226 RepID=E9D9X2_COCPS|nr:predicted protein [Coccidioides posadasii str. Silveira]